MPRITRNFWLTLDVDGKKTKIATGPRSSGGGFYLDIQVREKGAISANRFTVRGWISRDGHLKLVADADGSVVYERTAVR